MHKNTEKAKVLTASEAAQALGVSSRTILRYIASGRFPATKLPGRTGAWLINPRDLDRHELIWGNNS